MWKKVDSTSHTMSSGSVVEKMQLAGFLWLLVQLGVNWQVTKLKKTILKSVVCDLFVYVNYVISR